MSDKHRKPISNFFIKKSLQTRLIFKIVVAVVLSTLICAGTLLLTYYIKYQSVAFYRVILDHNLDIPPRENIIFIILPSLVISALVNLIIAFVIGLYASRKYAVPIYKLEHWADLLNNGKFTTKLLFREKEEFRELSSHCNRLGESLREKFLEIRKHVEGLGTDADTHVAELKKIIDSLELDASPIEVQTSYLKVSSLNASQPGASEG